MDNTAKGGLTLFSELFTMIPLEESEKLHYM